MIKFLSATTTSDLSQIFCDIQIDRIILKFSSSNCPSCKALDSSYKSLDLPSDIVVVDVFGPESLELTAKYSINKVPTSIVIDSSLKVCGSFIGFMKPATVLEFIDKYITSYKTVEE